MAKEWSFSILLSLLSFLVISQEKDISYRKKGLSIKAQSLILIRYDKNLFKDTYQTNFELKENSFLYGANGELNYFFNSHLATGFGFGYEKISQPNIIYIPAYINVLGYFSKKEKSLYSKLNLGVHLGNIDEKGFLFRFGLGVRLMLLKKVKSNIEFTYSFQNLNKTFENSNRPDNFYNLESIGLTLGIEIK
ncbi:hypothetical protein [Polaribacter sp.]|uniref:hypothetical protein n=1 Tax=Polaribacter sp. TaxID=1920175 RepID=UPI003EF32164